MKPLLSLDPLLKSLRDRHSTVQSAIETEQARPCPDGLKLSALKKLKLRVRDRIETLQGARHFDHPVTVVRRPSRKRFSSAEAFVRAPLA